MFEELLIGVAALTASGAVVNTIAALIRSRRDRTEKSTVEVTIHGNTLRVEGDDEAEIAKIVQAFVKLQQESEEAPNREEDGGSKT
ncbi:hypothetical protein ABGB16_31375 [Micromonospora sp. B11E3]|uniref:hypothetical protein n=1 Tax=Micromonospora sp. B11E3 TaxID=3153562 RepID=UPI00325C5A12